VELGQGEGASQYIKFAHSSRGGAAVADRLFDSFDKEPERRPAFASLEGEGQ
jgi:hypothetical protein